MKSIMAGSGGGCSSYSCASGSACRTQGCGDNCKSVNAQNSW